MASNTTRTSTTAPALTSRWVKVRSNPPTWYPLGTPQDCPTDHTSGEWVCTEDSIGTRFFIPRRGMAKDRRDALVTEALAARDMGKIAARDRQEAAADFLDTAKASPGKMLKIPFVAIAKVAEPLGYMVLGSGSTGGLGGGNISPSIGNISCGGMTVGCGGGH